MTPMTPQSPLPRSRWQFTLRSAMIGLTVCCAALGLAKWRGVSTALVVLLAADCCLFALCVYRRQRRGIVFWSACLVPLLAGSGLWFFGPASTEAFYCRLCGKINERETFLGITWYDAEHETEHSEWYRSAGLKLHSEQWAFLCSSEQQWGGGWAHYDSFGFELAMLDELREVSTKVDPATFEELAEEYYATRDDATRTGAFMERCEKILHPSGPEGDSEEPE